MYFLTALVASIISIILLILYKDRKKLHLEVLAITFGAATLMWLIDCIASAINGEGFLTFEFPLDGWISLWTVIGGILLWIVVAFVLNNNQKIESK